MKKLYGKVLSGALALTLLAGCSSTKTPSPSETQSTTPETVQSATPAATEDVAEGLPYEGVTLYYAATETNASNGETLELIERLKEDTGIEIQFTIVPNTADGEVDKTLVSLMAGDSIDIVYGTTSKLKTFYNADVLTELDTIADSLAYDIEGTFGSNAATFNGSTYGLAAYNDIWITLYNKKIFDDAGVDYPSAEDWTWDKYIETAQLLTDEEKGIYGSLMLDYDNYNYMLATQKGATPYKSDGTANFDDSRYAESLEFFYGLGNDEKIQPNSVLYSSGAIPWNSFVAGGNYGMFVCGGWVTSLLNNTEKYPRDWEAGILPMPSPKGETASTLSITGCYAVPVTSANPEAAFVAASYMAENQYTLGYGRIPARVDLTDEEVADFVDTYLVPAYELDNMTREDFVAAWFDPNRIIYPEKIIGAADTTINKIFVEEGQLYGAGDKSLEDTIASVQSRANAAIEEE